MRRALLIRTFVGFAVVSLSTPARAGQPEPESAPQSTLDAPDQDPLISNGAPTQMCQFPTTVLMFSGNSICTGTLIHPQVVTFAAHCGFVSEVSFGESFNNIWRTASVDFCMRNPEWDPDESNGVNGDDYAFCKLDQPVNDIPITPPVMGCELEMLRPNEPSIIVGFGNNDGDSGSGTKRWAETIIQTPVFQDSVIVAVGANGTAACNGDSGGPAYYQYPDGSWHAFGIVSGGPPCGQGADTYALIHRAVPFIEANAGVDVTPCHEPGGQWNPGPGCGGFATNIGAPNAGPNQGCSTEVSGLLATCGPANGAPPDLNPPFVSIEFPENNAELEANVELDILVDAQDPEFGVEAVGLLIDGELVATDENAPWEFEDASFPSGSYELVAVAEDYSGNVAQSNPVTVIVGDSGSDAGDGDGDPVGDGDGDPAGGEETTDGGLETGLETSGGFPTDPSLGDEGCNCAAMGTSGGASSETDGRGGAALGFGLALLGLAGLRRRRD